MSLRVFADNVMTLAIENCLISDIPNILSPDTVYNMTDEEIIKLGSESKQIQGQRDKLQLELKNLRIGLTTCREYRASESSG